MPSYHTMAAKAAAGYLPTQGPEFLTENKDLIRDIQEALIVQHSLNELVLFFLMM